MWLRHRVAYCLTISSLYEFMNYVMAKKIILMMNVGLCLSYPVNFAIYCGMSRYSFVHPSSVRVRYNS